jgi:hypothetical protein
VVGIEIEKERKLWKIEGSGGFDENDDKEGVAVQERVPGRS